MKLIKKKNRDLLYLSIVLILAITLSIFSVSIRFMEKLYSFFEIYTSLSIVDFLINFDFLYLSGLILLLYRRWRKAAIKQEELENVINSITPYVLIVADQERNIIMCSSSLKRMYGYEVNEVINQKTDLLYSDMLSNPEHNNEILDILGKEDFYAGLAEGKKKDGKTIPLEIITGNLRSRGGSVSLLKDITQRKQIEDELRIKDLAINSSINGIGIATLEGHMTYVNQSFLKMWGYDEKEVLGKHILEFCQKEKEVAEVIEALQDEGWVGEMKARRKDGSLFDVSVSASMVKDKDGNPICMMASFIDITEHKKSEELIENILESVDEGLIIIDRDYTIMTANKAFAEQSILPIDDIIGGKCYKISHNSDKPCYEKGEDCPVKHVFETEKYHESIHQHCDSKGAVTYIQIKAIPFSVNKSGKVSSVLETLIDITERKLYEESLIKTTKELKRLDQIKSDFISTASHELRTPLTSIKNAVDLILSRKTGEITDAQEKFLSMAQRNANRLSALINDLLDISRIESGRIQLNYTDVDIKNIIENVVNTFRSLANEKSISLKMNIAPDLPPIYGDASMIEQVLINLVNNAIKFTPARGTIAVDVHQVEGVSDMSEGIERFLETSVIDTGIGIPEEHVKHIFEKFYQVESSLSVKKQPGTGLGLAISKGMVEAYGGKIQCKSKEGVGSTFSFTLPIIGREELFYYSLKNKISKARQYHLPLSVLVIKLEDFAHVKEVYGIKECERVLEIVKEKIEKKGIKFTDKINVSRYNGEIIVLIIMPDTNRSGAQAAQARLKSYLTGIEIAVGESKYSCSFTSGVATYPDDAESAEELVDFAREKIEK